MGLSFQSMFCQADIGWDRHIIHFYPFKRLFQSRYSPSYLSHPQNKLMILLLELLCGSQSMWNCLRPFILQLNVHKSLCCTQNLCRNLYSLLKMSRELLLRYALYFFIYGFLKSFCIVKYNG
jgi:hypothetical protein